MKNKTHRSYQLRFHNLEEHHSEYDCCWLRTPCVWQHQGSQLQICKLAPALLLSEAGSKGSRSRHPKTGSTDRQIEICEIKGMNSCHVHVLHDGNQRVVRIRSYLSPITGISNTQKLFHTVIDSFPANIITPGKKTHTHSLSNSNHSTVQHHVHRFYQLMRGALRDTLPTKRLRKSSWK